MGIKKIEDGDCNEASTVARGAAVVPKIDQDNILEQYKSNYSAEMGQ